LTELAAFNGGKEKIGNVINAPQGTHISAKPGAML
jgi:hypothetical protein